MDPVQKCLTAAFFWRLEIIFNFSDEALKQNIKLTAVIAMLLDKKGSNTSACDHKPEILRVCGMYFRCKERMESRMEEDNGNIFLRSERVKNGGGGCV